MNQVNNQVKIMTNTIKKKRAALFFILGIAFISVWLTGCSKDKNEEALKVVLEQMYNCPDNELIELSNQITQADGIEIAPGLYSLENTDYFKKILELYQPYFSEKGLESFLNRAYPSVYHSDAEDNGYITKVEKIEVTRNKKIKTNYAFTVYLNYVPKEGDSQDIEINGSAQFAEEEGKITFIQFFDDLMRLIADK